MKRKFNKFTGLMLAFVLGPVVASAAPVEGPNGNYYEVFAAPAITWPAAEAIVSGLPPFMGASAHLATITSAEEDDFVDGLRFAMFGSGNKQVWIGGFQALPCAPEPTCGWTWVNGEGTFPGTNIGPEYTDWAGGEPNNSSGVEHHLTLGRFGLGGGWNDEGSALGSIFGYVVEYDVASRYVPPGAGSVISDGGSTGVSARYQNVLVGGNVSLNCCTVVDPREGTGTTNRYGDYDPVNFDLGYAIDNTESCAALRVYDGDMFGSNKAVLRPWQRVVPDPALVTAGDLTGAVAGVCLFQSDTVTQGVFVSDEDTTTVLGYGMDCTAEDIVDRPFTGGVAIDPPEPDSPFVNRITAECDDSRSIKRGSDNLIVLNLRHFYIQNDTKAYLSRLAGTLLDAIKFHSRPETFDPPDGPGCLDNSEGFVDNLLDLVETAKQNFAKKGDGEAAVAALENATRLALLIAGSAPVPSGDPYAACTENQQGLFVGRLMALTHATCSEWGEGIDPGPDAKADGLGGGRCPIELDILGAILP